MEDMMKSYKRAMRRKKDEAKACRKERIAQAIYSGGFHAPHGYYRKGKIHCSCAMCSAKTNGKINRSCGPVDPNVSLSTNGRRMATTSERYDRNYCVADRKKVDSLRNQVEEYFAG